MDLSANIKIERQWSSFSLGESHQGHIEPVLLLVARLQLLRRVEREVRKSDQHLAVPKHSADQLVGGAHGDREGGVLGWSGLAGGGLYPAGGAFQPGQDRQASARVQLHVCK